MNNKVVVGLVVLAFVLSGMVFGMGLVPQSASKTYRNDLLGFSFEYPKGWYIEEPPAVKAASPMALWLTNYNIYKKPTIAENEQIDILCNARRDLSAAPGNIEKRIISMIGPSGGRLIDEVKVKDTILVENGVVYLVEGKSLSAGIKGEKYDLGVVYLSHKKARYLIYFFPIRIPDKNAYMKVLRSVTLY